MKKVRELHLKIVDDNFDSCVLDEHFYTLKGHYHNKKGPIRAEYFFEIINNMMIPDVAIPFENPEIQEL